MTPTTFPEANAKLKPPADLEESQCAAIHAFHGQIAGGSIDGCPVTVTAWIPSPAELEDLKNGKPVFLSFIGALPPHFLTTDFYSAIHPA